MAEMDEIEAFYRGGMHIQDKKLLHDFCEASTLTYLEKGKALWNIGDKVPELYLLKEGGLHAVFYDHGGKEITDCFFYMPGDAALPNFDVDKPALTKAIAFKDSVLVTVPLQNVMRAIYRNFEGRDKYEELILRHSARHCMFKSCLQSFTAEERYKWFVDTYPELIGQVSDRCVASYLNMNAVTLSRVRKKLAAQAEAALPPQTQPEQDAQ